MKNILAFAILVLIIGLTIPTADAQSIPEWIKTNAGWWWSEGLISDEDFISGV